MPYTEGYHGTDESTARKILESGFQSGYPHSLFLAAPNQTYLAHMHGLKNAERTGVLNYAILKTSFPETDVQENFLGPESLGFYSDDIGKVAIIGFSIYSRNGELIEGDAVDITNQQ